MTTGMKSDSTVETRKRPNLNWLWLVLAVIIAGALIGYATTPKPPRTGADATSGSVQNSGTGQQGSVGGFAEKVVPNAQPGATSGTPLNTPPSSVSRAKTGGKTGENETSGTDAGSGNTGINNAPDGSSGADGKL